MDLSEKQPAPRGVSKKREENDTKFGGG